MPKRYSERILEFLRRPEYQPLKARRLAEAMGIAEAEFGDFHDAVDSLRRVGRVVLNSSQAVALPRTTPQVIGTYRANPRGFGFVVPDDPAAHGDLFIAPGESLDAVSGDKVRCQVVSRGKRDGKPAFGGRIVEIVERGGGAYVGRLQCEAGVWFVKPDGNTLHVPILIGDPTTKGARPGDQVVVEIVRYPSEGKPAKGVIIERLGKAGQAGVDALSIIRQFHLPNVFPEEVLAAVRSVAKSFDPKRETPSREDLTDRTIITIDPDDAKDFDDAISLERLDGDQVNPRKSRASGLRSQVSRLPAWELGIHIADVSHFVPPGGPIDEEARLRGTSVYLPRMVIPMLPEILSNGLCSLQEGEPRLCKSAFIQYDRDGKVGGARFANTVIRSAKRLTYRQAQAAIDGDRSTLSKDVIEILQRMDTLPKVIQRSGMSEGMISLELPQVELKFDTDGRVIDATPEDTSFTHTIIEMFMVEANEAVARLLDRREIPFIRRIHPEPDEQALESMARYMRAAGFSIPKTVTAADLQALLRPLAGKPQSYAVNLAVLKSMQTAEYSPKQIGHFALASKCYTHFTSPIRRYTDLTIHRLLQEVLQHEAAKAKTRSNRAQFAHVPSQEDLEELGRNLSYLSRRAESAESELRTLKVLELLARDHLGDEFEGVCTGVTNFGLFVQHPKYLVDGLLRLEDLGDDWWEVDLRAGRVVGTRTRQSFMMGSLLKVRMAEIDLAARQMKLALVGRSGRAARESGVVKALSESSAGRGRGKGPGRRGRIEGRRGKSYRKRGGRR